MRLTAWSAALAAACLAASPALAGNTQPSLRYQPGEPIFFSYYPMAAVDDGIESNSWVACEVTAEGEVRDCSLRKQSVPGFGFGNAAVNYAPKLRFRPATVDGVPVSSRVIIPVYWRFYDYQLPRALAKPTEAELLAAYPADARQAGRDGRASIECDVPADGSSLRDCMLAGDPPTEAGFGQAALALGSRFRVAYCAPTSGLFRRKLASDRVKLNFYWFAARAEGPEEGPVKAVVGFSSRWRSAKYGADIDRGAC